MKVGILFCTSFDAKLVSKCVYLTPPEEEIVQFLSRGYLGFMCGRYALAQEHEALKIRYGFLDTPQSSFHQTPRYNIAPTQLAAVITNGTGNKLFGMRWGLIPHWAKDPAIGNSLINARSETVEEKPSFRESFRKNRCLIPASGFFEWKKPADSKTKQPYFIRVKKQEIFSFAGLWSSWHDPTQGSEILSYTILTTEPNDFMRNYHHRMPVILSMDAEKYWLSSESDFESLKGLLVPCLSDILDAYPVSLTVNSPRNDTVACIQRMSPQM